MIYKNETYEYYLEKVGYGNLLFAFATKEKIEPNKEYIEEYISIAQKTNFWGKE
jgi:hypothetical protein